MPSSDSPPPEDRGDMFRTLRSLPPPQFEELLNSLQVPGGIISSPEAPQGKRTSELLGWIGGPSGPGWRALDESLATIIEPGGVGRDLTRDVPRETVEIPQNIPPSGTFTFVGREKQLSTVHERFEMYDWQAIIDGLGSSKGGKGKTELAIQYALQYLAYYKGGVCWISFKEDSPNKQLVDFFKLNFPWLEIPRDIGLSNQVSHCWKRWPLKERTLLILDGVDDSLRINQCKIPSNIKHSIKVLITSQTSMGLPTGFPQNQILYLGGLELDESLSLFKQLVGTERVENKLDTYTDICGMLDNIPLFIHEFAEKVKRG